MAEKRPSQPPKHGPLGKLAKAIVGFAFWVVLGALGNIVVEWVGMRLAWPEEGVKHSLATLESELKYIDRDFPEGIFIAHPARFSRRLAARVHDTAYKEWRLGSVFGAAGPVRSGGRLAPNASFGEVADRWLGGGGEYLLAAVIATQIYAIRLGVMIGAIPVFLLAALVAISDGLGQRDLRRFGGGRERGQVYHLARGFVFPLFTLPWVLYLSWPATVHPNWFVLP
ncbi:TIGR03747 family integrating conjugative element membrane protein, partial [Methylomagnum sp.]